MTTFTGALRVDGMTAPMVLDGLMNRVAFQAYIEQVLVPTLHRGDTVIMDNLPAHKGAEVRRAIEAVGAMLLYLPPYSPDFNPIETPSPSSRHSYGRLLQGPSTTCRTSSAMPCRPSHHKTAPTTSPQPDMSQTNRIPL